MNSSRYWAFAMGLMLAFPACAYVHLIGEYAGKLSSVEGYKGNVGDPCAVKVGTSNMYGGALTFEIPDYDKLAVETRNVQKELEQKSDAMKFLSPGGSGKPIEVVIMKLGNDGAMQSLMLKQIWKQQHREKSVACGDLLKK